LRHPRSRVQSAQTTQRSKDIDTENAPSIILPIAIMIAILAACGIISMALALLAGVITLAA